VLFVVPTFNRAAELSRTIQAIAGQRWPADRLSVLVIDNGSTDDTGKVLADLAECLPIPIRHLCKAPEGPTVARNIGLRCGVGGFVALVDSDVELDAGWTAATARVLAADPILAQVGGKLVFGHDPNVLNSYGGVLGQLGLAWDHAEGEPADSETEARDVLWINTAAVLMRPEPVLAVGGFDERFFYGGEEPDLVLRLAMAGLRSRVVPDALALHHSGTVIGTSHPNIIFHYTKNRVNMALKSFGWARLVWFVPASVIYILLDAIVHRPRQARLRALVWNLRHVGETWRLRQKTWECATRPNRAVMALLSSRWFPPKRLAGLRRRPVRGTAIAITPDDRVQCTRDFA